MAQEEYTVEQASDDIGELRGQIDRMNEIIQLIGASVPNIPASGEVDLFASGGQVNYINAAGLQMGLVGSQNATFPGTTVTAASLQNLVTAAYPANDAETGATYQIEINCNGTWGSTQQTLELGVAFGGTAMCNVTLGSTLLAVSTNFRIKLRGRVYCHTTGSGGTWSSEIEGMVSAFNVNLLPNTGSQASMPFTSSESTTTYTVDTTANQTFAIQAAWGSTTGAPTITCNVALFGRIA